MTINKNISAIIPVIVILVLFLQGCFITNTPGFYSGYKKLNENQKEAIIFPTGDLDICNRRRAEKIFSVTAAQLRKCLSSTDTAVIYLWSPFCSSSVCVSLNAAKDYCNKKGYQLYVFMEYYTDLAELEIKNPSKIPLYTINQKYYKTDYCIWYENRFLQDLIGARFSKKKSLGNRFYFFHNGSFVKSSAVLFENSF